MEIHWIFPIVETPASLLCRRTDSHTNDHGRSNPHKYHVNIVISGLLLLQISPNVRAWMTNQAPWFSVGYEYLMMRSLKRRLVKLL